MKGRKFTGIMPALVTPLEADNYTINTEVAKKLIEFHLGQGADGFYVLGGTGEGLVMSQEQRMIMCDTAIRCVNGRKPVIMHVAAMHMREAIEFAKYAEKAGADAIASVPPFHFFYDESDIYNYYKRLASAVQIPLIIYYHPSAQAHMSPELLARIFQIDNVTGVKWSDSNYYGMLTLKDLTQGDMNIINGPDQTLCCGLMAGADAGIGSTYNTMLPQFLEVYRLVKAGDVDGARAMQMKINRSLAVMCRHEVIPSVKAALELIGFPVGSGTFPMRQIEGAEKQAFEAELRQAGFFDLKR